MSPRRPAVGDLLRRAYREETGRVRGIVFFLALLAIATLVVLDVLAIHGAHGAVRDDVDKAARLAVASYLSRASAGLARQEAVAYLDGHGVSLLRFRLATTQGVVACTIRGRGSADTFILKYLAGLPKVGIWLKGRLNPEATAAAP